MTADRPYAIPRVGIRRRDAVRRDRLLAIFAIGIVIGTAFAYTATIIVITIMVMR